MNVRMKNCEFYTDKSKGLVVCTFRGAENIFKDFARDNTSGMFNEDDYNNPVFSMNHSFVGKAWLEDEWDERKGKELAFYRMKDKLLKSFYKRMKTYFDLKEKQLDDFESVCVSVQKKCTENMLMHLKNINGDKED